MPGASALLCKGRSLLEPAPPPLLSLFSDQPPLGKTQFIASTFGHVAAAIDVCADKRRQGIGHQIHCSWIEFTMETEAHANSVVFGSRNIPYFDR